MWYSKGRRTSMERTARSTRVGGNCCAGIYMRGLDLGSLFIEDRGICLKLDRLDVDGCVADIMVPACSAFRV